MTVHEVHVLCNCDNVEQCELELYVSDVRIAYGLIKLLEATLKQGRREEMPHPIRKAWAS